MFENGSGLFERIIGGNPAVGPNLQNELIIIGDLTDAGCLDRILHETNRGKERINRDHTDSLLFLLILLAGIITPAGLDLNLRLEITFRVQRADYLVGIYDRDIRIRLNLGRCHRTHFVSLDRQIDDIPLVGHDEHLL